MQGFIKLYRSLLEWEWYTDNNTKIVFLHILLTASHKPYKYRGQTLNAGQVVTSRRKLARETGLTEAEVKTALGHLTTTHEITQQTTHRNTLVTVENWGKWQGTEKKTTHQTTHKMTHQPPSIKQECKEDKEGATEPPIKGVRMPEDIRASLERLKSNLN